MNVDCETWVENSFQRKRLRPFKTRKTFSPLSEANSTSPFTSQKSLINSPVRWNNASLYTSRGDSWLNMAESIQNILKDRALRGQNPKNPEQIIAWLHEVCDYWNKSPTPFEWGGKRYERRIRSKKKLRNLKGSGAKIKVA